MLYLEKEINIGELDRVQQNVETIAAGTTTTLGIILLIHRATSLIYHISCSLPDKAALSDDRHTLGGNGAAGIHQASASYARNTGVTLSARSWFRAFSHQCFRRIFSSKHHSILYNASISPRGDDRSPSAF